jgi:hypothetical protein
MINLLKQIFHSSTKIDHLLCRFTHSFHLSFITELAKILPHLKYLSLCLNAIDDYNQDDILQKSFKYIMSFDVRTNIKRNKREMIDQELKQWLHEQYINMIFLEDKSRSKGFTKTIFRLFF